jgi:hypothetical protein
MRCSLFNIHYFYSEIFITANLFLVSKKLVAAEIASLSSQRLKEIEFSQYLEEKKQHHDSCANYLYLHGF